MEQDWKPLIIRKTETKSVRGLTPESDTRPQFSEGHKETKKLDSADPDPPKILGLKAGQQIQQARCAKGWTQVQLAGKIAVDQATIRDYESGKAIGSRAVLNKLNKVLGIKIEV